ncbi:MAG TPA: signal peptide peptidase SppA [Candidatus Nanoarchaeia archaeon]|nr:signal peptide peptidase SppA [Candidatus Nanoarchaeia archaeon]
MAKEKQMDYKGQEPKFSWKYSIWTLFVLLILGFFAVIIISIVSGTDVDSISGNVAVIPIEGAITGSSDSDSIFSSEASSLDIVKQIEKADKNPNIKAIVLRINSPGGSAVASEEIANAVKAVNKTTVAWIREVGASGAYWIASSSDHIIASRVSITGSIGVISSYLEFDGLLNDYNVTYRRLVSGKYKDIGSPFKEMTQEEEQIFQKNLEEIRDVFVSEVALNRHMNKKDVEKAANGLFYIGQEAKNLGLIDELGSKEEVVSYIEQKENIKAEFVEYKKEKGLLSLLSEVMSKQSFNVGKGIGSSLFDNRESSAFSITT